MRSDTNEKVIAWLAFVSGISISAVAVWYSVAGLVSIFAAAALPIIIMGVALEVSKLIATIWLKVNWTRAPKLIKTYLIIAITILMMITSMGIFGFLSKAHLDQAVPTGDVADKVALIDEKIKTQRENVDAARKALRQMDESVDQTLARSSDEKGADKAAALRRGQQRERAALQNDISKAQKEIAILNAERAPIAKELRAVEAEVGPIKYIAALLYGDEPDQNLLEKAVRWVIIIIVVVFDPLAVILLLASQYSFQWLRREQDPIVQEQTVVEPVSTLPITDPVPSNDPVFKESTVEESTFVEPTTELTVSSVDWTDSKLTVDFPSEVSIEVETQEIKPEEIPVDETTDESIIDAAVETEKEAMRRWKEENPEDSLKHQRRLFDKGIISKLPWEDYLKVQPDYISDNEAAEEALKWANEQIVERPGDYLPETESKKKDNSLDGEAGQTTDQENQRGLAGYQQNAEQSELTLWQRIQNAKK